MDIDLTLGFVSPPSDPGGFPGDSGALRIVVDGEVLTAHVLQDHIAGIEDLYDAEGNPIAASPADFTGEIIGLTLKGLHDAVVQFKRGDYERFEEIPVEHTSAFDQSAITLSFADGEHARITFQPMHSRCEASNYRDASLRGYLIDPDDLCRELIGCYREWMRYVDNTFGDRLPDDVADFHQHLDGKITELEATIDQPTRDPDRVR